MYVFPNRKDGRHVGVRSVGSVLGFLVSTGDRAHYQSVLGNTVTCREQDA